MDLFFKVRSYANKRLNEYINVVFSSDPGVPREMHAGWPDVCIHD